MTRLIIRCALFLLASSFVLGCEVINPAEEVPSFIHITPFELQTEHLRQGSADHKITEAWVTVNGEFLGAYALPATVPVLMTGPVEVRIEAGIKENGISATPDIYPFYAPYDTALELEAALTDTIQPTTTYLSTTRFALIEDFEQLPVAFSELILGNTGMVRTTDDVFEGLASGRIDLSEDNPQVELATAAVFSGLTERSVQVYLEVNYRSEAPVIFGLIGGSGTPQQQAVYDPGFNPKDQWNKIYFNLSTLLAGSPFDQHQLALRAFIPIDNGQLTQNSATVWLDNIKLVHF